MPGKRVFETEEAVRKRICEAIAMDGNLDGTDLRVFLYLAHSLNFTVPFRKTQLEMALVLGKRKEHISRAIRSLIEAGVLLAGPKGPRSSEWLLNPDYGREDMPNSVTR